MKHKFKVGDLVRPTKKALLVLNMYGEDHIKDGIYTIKKITYDDLITLKEKFGDSKSRLINKIWLRKVITPAFKILYGQE